MDHTRRRHRIKNVDFLQRNNTPSKIDCSRRSCYCICKQSERCTCHRTTTDRTFSHKPKNTKVSTITRAPVGEQKTPRAFLSQHLLTSLHGIHTKRRPQPGAGHRMAGHRMRLRFMSRKLNAYKGSLGRERIYFLQMKHSMFPGGLVSQRDRFARNPMCVRLAP